MIRSLFRCSRPRSCCSWVAVRSPTSCPARQRRRRTIRFLVSCSSPRKLWADRISPARACWVSRPCCGSGRRGARCANAKRRWSAPVEQANPAVTFVGVAAQDQASAMQKFVDTYPVKGFTHLADTDGAVWANFGVTYQPAYAFIDPDGGIDVVKASLSQAELTERVPHLPLDDRHRGAGLRVGRRVGRRVQPMWVCVPSRLFGVDHLRPWPPGCVASDGARPGSSGHHRHGCGISHRRPRPFRAAGVASDRLGAAVPHPSVPWSSAWY